MTLYEMTTGCLPIWGDGRSDPAVIDHEVTLDVGRFDPNLRDEMVAFSAVPYVGMLTTALIMQNKCCRNGVVCSSRRNLEPA